MPHNVGSKQKIRDDADFNIQQMDDEIDLAMNETFDTAAMDSGSIENFR